MFGLKNEIFIEFSMNNSNKNAGMVEKWKKYLLKMIL